MALRNDDRHGLPPHTCCGKRTESQIEGTMGARELPWEIQLRKNPDVPATAGQLCLYWVGL